MSIAQDLLNDDKIVKSFLKDMIIQEAKRVIDSGLITKQEIVNLIDTKDLVLILSSLSKLKIAGDKLDCVVEKIEQKEIVSEDIEPVVIVKVEEQIINELEKIAYDVGKNGDHETAYIIEKTIKEIEKLK
jgi:hypothetical protein